MQESTVINDLRQRVEAASYRKVADDLGFTYGFINQVVRGRARMSDRLALSLGYERVVTYRRVA